MCINLKHMEEKSDIVKVFREIKTSPDGRRRYFYYLPSGESIGVSEN